MAAAIDLKPAAEIPDSAGNANKVSTAECVLAGSQNALCTSVSSAAISPYINATGSASFHNCPNTFNIHAGLAQKARAMLKRKHKLTCSLPFFVSFSVALEGVCIFPSSVPTLPLIFFWS